MDRRGRRGKPVPGFSRKLEGRRGGRGRAERETDEGQMKPPVILAKPHPVVDNNEEEWPTISAAAAGKVMVIKSRTHSPALVEAETSKASASVGQAEGREKRMVLERKGSGGTVKHPGIVHIQSSARADKPAAEAQVFTNTRYAAKNERPSPETGRKRGGAPGHDEGSLKGGIHIISEHMDWIDNAQETDFLVIGVIGCQGTGKSTLLSMLGGNVPMDMFRQYIFRPASREATETCKHQTAGVQFYVTSTRVILLDAQAVCSPAILDEMIRLDRRYNYEYKTAENFMEVESMQIVTFMLQVCHVLMVTTEWFLDFNFLRFLRSAEMLKPSVSMSDPAGYLEHFPHLVLVHQRGKSEDFQIPVIKSRSRYFERMMSGTQTLIKSGISLGRTSITAFSNGSLDDTNHINYFILPDMKLRGQRIETSSKHKIIPDYEVLIKELRLMVRSLPRPPFSQTLMTEKAWLQYATRAWDNVRKSHMIAEFGRTLP